MNNERLIRYSKISLSGMQLFNSKTLLAYLSDLEQLRLFCFITSVAPLLIVLLLLISFCHKIRGSIKFAIYMDIFHRCYFTVDFQNLFEEPCF